MGPRSPAAMPMFGRCFAEETGRVGITGVYSAQKLGVAWIRTFGWVRG